MSIGWSRTTSALSAWRRQWPTAGPTRAWTPKTVATNIVLFAHPDSPRLLDYFRASGVLAGTVAPGVVRLVTHADVDDEGIEEACQVIAHTPDR